MIRLSLGIFYVSFRYRSPPILLQLAAELARTMANPLGSFAQRPGRSPKDGTSFRFGESITFDWSDVAGTAGYTIQISTQSSACNDRVRWRTVESRRLYFNLGQPVIPIGTAESLFQADLDDALRRNGVV
jgi:hypothetical protein